MGRSHLFSCFYLFCRSTTYGSMQIGHFAFVPTTFSSFDILNGFQRSGPGNIFEFDTENVIEFDFYSTGFENGVALPTLSQGNGRLIDRLFEGPEGVSND